MNFPPWREGLTSLEFSEIKRPPAERIVTNVTERTVLRYYRAICITHQAQKQSLRSKCVAKQSLATSGEFLLVVTDSESIIKVD